MQTAACGDDQVLRLLTEHSEPIKESFRCFNEHHAALKDVERAMSAMEGNIRSLWEEFNVRFLPVFNLSVQKTNQITQQLGSPEKLSTGVTEVQACFDHTASSVGVNALRHRLQNRFWKSNGSSRRWRQQR